MIKGVGPEAPTITTLSGGRHSDSPYRADLLPPLALLAVAEVLKAGSEKYGPDNWKLIPVSDHINHVLVHLLALQAGDGSDEHLRHATCRLLFALELVEGAKG